MEWPVDCCCSVVFGYRYLGDSGSDRSKILHDGSCRSRVCLLPFWGQYPRGILKIQNFGPVKREYLEDSKSQCYVSIGHQLDEGFLKIVIMGW